MEVAIGIFCTIITLVVLFNTILLIGIAGSLAKLIKYMNADDTSPKDQWARIIRERRSLHMQEGNQATYADIAGSQKPIARPSLPQWDGMPRKPNWDGVPKIEE